MVKFIVTGSVRSGTTFLASVLNSQQNTFCLEDYIWRNFPRTLKYFEDLQYFSNVLDANFMYLGLRPPKLQERANVDDDLIELYISHLKEIFNCEHVGFKRTLMTEAEMADRVNDGYKIIILKRDTEKILKSMVGRIDTNVDISAERLYFWLKDIRYYSPKIPFNSYMVIDFDEMLFNLDETLGKLETFLGFKVQNPQILYHSFNKGRAAFGTNSSFVNLGPKTLARSLPKKYDDQIFKKLASQIDTKKFRPSLKRMFSRFVRKYVAMVSSYYR